VHVYEEREDMGRVEMSVSESAHNTFFHDGTQITGLLGNFSDNTIAYNSHFTAGIYNLNAQRTEVKLFGNVGSITKLANSDADTNLLMTSSRTGTAKIYDIRVPSAVMSLDCLTSPMLACCFGSVSAALFAFVGGCDERIITWDLRSSKALYELSTGNNTVIALNWHQPTSTLAAATECDFIDDNGYLIGSDYYDTIEEEIKHHRGVLQGVKVPQNRWPLRAQHKANEFRHKWDAKIHGHVYYQFKHNPTGTLPTSGYTTGMGSLHY